MGITARNITINGKIIGKDFVPGPPPAPPVPANFRYNTLLLPGTGTNNATNNTFIDNSSNGFTVTRVGNTTQGSFSPFSTAPGYYSNYFDGSGDYLTFPSNSSLAFGTNAYTVEFWIYMPSYQNQYNRIIDLGQSNGSFGVQIHNDRIISITKYGAANVVESSQSFVLNQWNHIAVVRNSTESNDTKIYLNGISIAIGTDSNDWTVVTTPRVSGISALQFDFSGYISNLRVVKGTAVYTTNFTPSTTPLTAVSGTSLLTCQNNRFMDSSSNNFAVTVVGNTEVSPYGPFDPTSTYNAATMGGSMYFDGSGDLLSVANNVALNFGTSQFTVEAWIYPTSISASALKTIVGKWNNGDNWLLVLSETNKVRFYYSQAPGTSITSTITVVANEWTHIAVSRDASNNLRIYVNGVNSGSTVSNFNSSTISPVTIGSYLSGSYFTGQISNVRLVKGSAVYSGTASFTPPTAPVTDIANTSLLLNGTNAAIVDTTAKNNLETVGDAKISTTVSASGSIYLPTNGSKLAIPPSDLFAYGTGAFTIEAWVYPTAYDTVYGSIIFGQNRSGTNYLMSGISTNGTIFFTYGTGGGGTPLSGNISASLNTWTHLAWIREGTGANQFKMYVNGNLAFTGTVAQNFDDTTQNTVCIGNYPHANQLPFYGYINDLRVTKGLARYTGNFTPPTRS